MARTLGITGPQRLALRCSSESLAWRRSGSPAPAPAPERHHRRARSPRAPAPRVREDHPRDGRGTGLRLTPRGRRLIARGTEGPSRRRSAPRSGRCPLRRSRRRAARCAPSALRSNGPQRGRPFRSPDPPPRGRVVRRADRASAAADTRDEVRRCGGRGDDGRCDASRDARIDGSVRSWRMHVVLTVCALAMAASVSPHGRSTSEPPCPWTPWVGFVDVFHLFFDETPSGSASRRDGSGCRTSRPPTPSAAIRARAPHVHGGLGHGADAGAPAGLDADVLGATRRQSPRPPPGTDDGDDGPRRQSGARAGLPAMTETGRAHHPGLRHGPSPSRRRRHRDRGDHVGVVVRSQGHARQRVGQS